MTDFKEFFDAIQQSVTNDEFVKLTLSKPLRKSDGLLNVYIRLLVVEGKGVFNFKYRNATEDVFKEFSLKDAIVELETLLMKSFRTGTLFTLQEDLLVMVSKKKLVSYQKNAPTFKNKLPNVDEE